MSPNLPDPTERPIGQSPRRRFQEAYARAIRCGRAAGRHVAPRAIVRFLGTNGLFWRLLIRGAVLLMFTLGIYRFWLATDIRRFLWSNTELAGDSFEYSGTARELLLGFLIALTILVPLYSCSSSWRWAAARSANRRACSASCC